MQRTDRNYENIVDNQNARLINKKTVDAGNVKNRLAFNDVGNPKNDLDGNQREKLKEKGKINYKVTPHVKVKDTEKVTMEEELNDTSDKLQNMSIQYENNQLIEKRSDSSNVYFLPEYAQDIYDYLLEVEKIMHVKQSYYRSMTYISSKIRSIVVDWIMQICIRFQLLNETFQLSVSLFDRYLQTVDLKREEIQVVACSAVMIACKYEEMLSPAYDDFMYVSDGVFEKIEIKRMEISMLMALDIRINRPVPINFLKRFTKITKMDEFRYTASKYLIEMSIIDSKLCHVLPSRIAASAMCLSLKLSSNSKWTSVYSKSTRYSEPELIPVMQRMCMNLRSMSKNDYWLTVYNKYSSSSMFAVAKHAIFSENPMINLFAEGKF